MDYVKKLQMAVFGLRRPKEHSGEKGESLRCPSSRCNPTLGKFKSFAIVSSLKRHLKSKHEMYYDVEEYSNQEVSTVKKATDLLTYSVGTWRC